jgi:DNA-binding NtrC family response regulator
VTSGARAGRGAILVVESQDAVRRFLIRVLDRVGYDARGTASGRDALAALIREPKAYAMLVTDLDLADIDGDVFARGVRAVAPGLPVLFMTAGGRPRSSSPGPALEKPFSHDVFLAAVVVALSEA